MSGRSLDEIKANVLDLALDPKSGYAIIQSLIAAGELDHPISSSQIVHRIAERFGKRWKTSRVQVYMKKFMELGLVQAIKPAKSGANFWVLTHISRSEGSTQVRADRRIIEIETELFSSRLQDKLGSICSSELKELHDNFGKNGLSTAFLLRKILEKLLIIVFGKHDRQHLIRDRHNPERWRGLDDMIDIAAQEKMSGIPFLLPKTAKEVKGVKFLGDTAAHNPLASVDIKTIVPQMPYIITAYEELANRL